jgi:hypothetical protein
VLTEGQIRSGNANAALRGSEMTKFERRCKALGEWWKSCYAMLDYRNRRHHERLKSFIERMPKKLLCQECGGAGGEVEWVCELGGPFVTCGWCEGIGYVTPWMRALWLKYKREDKHSKVG